ncbi:MAG: hypothetical protein LBJ10_03735 [Clostridiales bacterium]|jgi:hypothetical protein|nr:hypothetical protein [Clostridiales bacterium]
MKKHRTLKYICAALAAAGALLALFAFADRAWLLRRADSSDQRVAVRKFPYPYRSMASLSSDCDGVSIESFEQYHRFLNTHEDTQYGTGIGLDVADSFWVYSASENYGELMTYCLGLDPGAPKDAAAIKKYVECGWIDSIHAMGEFSEFGGGETKFTRSLALSAWDGLLRDGISPIVWIDHGNEGNVQNFGSYSPFNSSKYQRGDDRRSAAYYHADATLAGGIKYVWHSRHSDRHAFDFPLAVRTLRDGQNVWAFSRYTSVVVNGAIQWRWHPDALWLEITEDKLSALAENWQYGMFAQHFAYYGADHKYSGKDIKALRLLQNWQDDKEEILVARTSRLLEYATMQKYVEYEAAITDTLPRRGVTSINVLAIRDPLFPDSSPDVERLRGLTFYCDEPAYAMILVNGARVDEHEITRNEADSTGRKSISIKWHEPDRNDYTRADGFSQ